MKIPYTQIKTCGWILFCVLIQTQPFKAQQLTTSIPTIYTSSGLTALSEFSFIANPALCLRFDSAFTGATFAPSVFGMSELHYGGIVAGNRLAPNFAFVGAAGGFASTLYSEFSAILGSATQLGENLILGSTFEFSRINVKDFSATSKIEVNAGALLILSSRLTAGVSISNITRGSYSVNSRVIRQKILLGIGVEILPTLFLDADAIISLNEYSGVTLAARYDMLDEVQCRLAISTAPRSAELSVALRPYRTFTVLAIGHYHDVLGITQQMSLIWYW